MPLPSSGPISMSQVAGELGVGASGINLNQGNVRTLAGVPSGAIGMVSLRGKSNAIATIIDKASLNAIGFASGNSASGSALARITFDTTGTWVLFASPNGGGSGRQGRYALNAISTGDDYQLYWTDPYGYAYGTGQNGWSTLNAQVQINVFDSQGESQNAEIQAIIRRSSNHADTHSFVFNLYALGACFAVGTMLRTPDGDRAVESLVTDDFLCSFFEDSMVDESVEGWRNWKIDSTRDLMTDTLSLVKSARHFKARKSVKLNGLHCTVNHTHFVFDGTSYGWKVAADITTNDSFVDHERNLVPITSIEHITDEHTFVALNVEDIDTLQVKYGDTYLLTHNVSA